jgi:thiamine-monophosphate kinase
MLRRSINQAALARSTDNSSNWCNMQAESPEFRVIDCILEATSSLQAEGVVVGIGDDAALLQPDSGLQLLACTDTLVAGVHFPVDTTPAAIAYKSVAVNLSDLAAMGARPRWATLSLTLPDANQDWVRSFAEGLCEAARPWGLGIVGGDTCAGPLAVSVHMIGDVPGDACLLRSGAQVGDLLAVTGTLGDAALALSLIQTQGRDRVPAALLRRLEHPTARIEAGQALRGLATACIDVSDGLLADAGHIARSSGVGVVIEAEMLPSSPAFVEQVDSDQRYGLQAAGGDDYELCFTFAPTDRASIEQRLRSAGQSWQVIGRVETGHKVRLVDALGKTLPVDRIGYQHFRG